MGILKEPHDFLRDLYPPLTGMIDQLDTEPKLPSMPRYEVPRQTLPPQYNNPCQYWHAVPPAIPEKKTDWGTRLCAGYTILVASILLIKLLFDSVLK